MTYRVTPNDVIFRFFNTLLLAVISFITFYPFIYMVMLSLSSGNVIGRFLLWPINFDITPYRLMLDQPGFFDALRISVMRASMGPFLTIIVSFMAGYALSKDYLWMRRFFSRYIIFALMFSPGMLPMYLNMVTLNLTNTFMVYIFPMMLHIMGIVLIRTYIQQMPRTLEESAYLDGANDLQVAFRIVMPLCKPVMAAIILFSFIDQWNAYMDTLLFNSMSPRLFTLQYNMQLFLARQQVFSLTDFPDRHTFVNFNLISLRMAMTVILCIPVLIVYPFLQKYFIKGILIGSIKG